MSMEEDWETVNARRSVNVRKLHTLARVAVPGNRDFLALPDPVFPLSAADEQALVQQVQALTRQINGVIRLLVGDDMLEATD